MRRALAFLRTGRGLSTFAAVALAWMLLVVLEGAVVRATGSGAGCGAHWPLCNGQILPHHPRLATVIEFTHRSMTGVCTALTAGVIAWTFLARRAGTRVRKAGAWSGFLLLTEALLGAVLVLGGFVEHNTSNLRVFVQGVHFTNTLLLLAALSLTWWWQHPRPAAELSAAEHPTVERRSAVSPLLALGALGSVVLTGATGSVAALADTLFPAVDLRSAVAADLASNSPLLVRMRWVHPASSALVVVFVLLLAARCRRHRTVLLSLLALQVVLGTLDVLTLTPLTLQVLHLLAGDLLWMAMVITVADGRLAHRLHRADTAFTGARLSPGPGRA